MKIGVDAGCLGITDKRLKVGVYQVVKNLLYELGKIDIENSYYLYSFNPIDEKLMRSFGNQMKNIVVRPTRGWLKIWLPLRLVKDKPAVFIALNQAFPLPVPFFSRHKTIGIVYDIAFEKYPQLYGYAASVSKHRKQSKALARNADILIAISNKTKEDILEYYHVPQEKVITAYPGIPDRIITNVSFTRPGKKKLPYFLFVGAFKKTKNIPTLIKAFHYFKKKSKTNCELILIGGDKWLDPEIEAAMSEIPSSVRERIKNYSFVTDTTLVALYKGAIAFVCPTLYEGFGLPFVEAMSLGCPVIGSTAGAVPEIVENAGILIDPFNIEGIGNAMLEISSNTKLRKKCQEQGYIQSQKYSWKTFANVIHSAIQTFS